MKDFDAAAELYSAGISKFASRNIQSGDQVLVKLGSTIRPTVELDITTTILQSLQSNISMENHGKSTIHRCLSLGRSSLVELFEESFVGMSTELRFFLPEI